MTAIRTCWNHYHMPDSVEGALKLLAEYGGQAQLIGGGTDLLLEIQQGARPPAEAMVDTSRISGLDRIVHESGRITIGCAVTHTQIVNDDSVNRHGTCLAEACGVIGGPQVRNVATLAGNVAHALPAGDGSIGLLALGGEVEVADSGGRRWMDLQDTFLGPGKSAIDHHRALLTRLRFRATGHGEGSAFFRVMRPQGVALPMISMAVRLQLHDDETVAAARVALGPAGPVPFLAGMAADLLQGQRASASNFEQAADAVLQSATLRNSPYRATREYRQEMIRTQLPLVLERAAERARNGGPGPGMKGR
jgi:carbon-monoxide dehydrogenase medium subunit